METSAVKTRNDKGVVRTSYHKQCLLLKQLLLKDF